MALSDVLQQIDTLSREELETVTARIRQQRERLGIIEVNTSEGDRHNEPLDMDFMRQLSADLREGFTEQDLEELEWAMNVEYIEPFVDEYSDE